MVHRDASAVGALNYVVSGVATVGAVLGGLKADSLTAWAGALVAILAAVWGLWRDQRRRDREEARTDAVLDLITQANETAIKAGQPAPYPDYLPVPSRAPAK
jgi:Flp pilus assembly protein TadB